MKKKKEDWAYKGYTVTTMSYEFCPQLFFNLI